MSKSEESSSRVSRWFGSAIRSRHEEHHDPFAPAVVEEFLAARTEPRPRSLAVEALLLPATGEPAAVADADGARRGSDGSRRLFADAAASLHSLYPQATPAELAAMANALAQAATGDGVDDDIAVPTEILQRARLGLAAGARGVGDIREPGAALRTAIAVMADAVVGRWH